MLKDEFNILFDFVNVEDIVILKSVEFGETYRYSKEIEHPDFPGFYLIPGLNRHLISKEGDLLSFGGRNKPKVMSWQKQMAQNWSRGGYRGLGIRPVYGSQKIKVLRHRLLMLTFSEYDQHPKHLHVNHINGIGGDDRLTNLEWTTLKENADKAYSEGLNKRDRVTLEMWNRKTGEKKVFHTLTEASTFTGLTIPTIVNRLNPVNQAKLYPDQISFKRPLEQWLEIETIHKSEGSPKSIICWDIANNVHVSYNSIISASKALGVAKSQITKQCVNKLEYPNHGYIFRYKGEENTFPEFSELQLEWFKILEYPAIPKDGVMLTDLNGSVEYLPIKEASKKFKLHSSSIYISAIDKDLIDGKSITVIPIKGKVQHEEVE